MRAINVVVSIIYKCMHHIFFHTFFCGKLSGSKANLEYEILAERIIDGLLSIPSVFIIHEALVHVRIEWFWINYSRKRNL